MDLDAMHRHVGDLRKFKERVEEIFKHLDLSHLLSAGADVTSAADLAVKVEDLGKHVEELAGVITMLQQADIGGRLDKHEELLQKLVVSKEEAESFSLRLDNMLTWFEANQEGLEVLLTLGEGQSEPDAASATGGGSGTAGTDLGTAGGASSSGGAASTGGGTAADGAAGAAGSGSAGGGTNDPANPDPAQQGS